MRHRTISLSLMCAALAPFAACALRPAGGERGEAHPRAVEASPVVRAASGADAAPDLDGIDAVVEAAIARGDVPGAVVAVVRDGRPVFERAYGARSVVPERRPMTVDTVFDLGSLTKVIATAPSILLLAEQGKLALSAPVSRYMPEFAQQGKGGITIEQLLTHTSGLAADNDLRDYADGPARAIERIDAQIPIAPPGERFVYSDIGYIVLGALVERVSGERLDVFARRHLFEPLGMRDTTFAPGGDVAARAAPTVVRDGRLLQGAVHDPRAERLGGVAGHAGLFATSSDLARFARMLLNEGELDGVRVLERASIREMTRSRALPGGAGRRALGWDIWTKRARGAMVGGLGHTGFPGTSIWVIPARKAAVIVLSNRLHPDGGGSSERLRREVADVVARSLGR